MLPPTRSHPVALSSVSCWMVWPPPFWAGHVWHCCRHTWQLYVRRCSLWSRPSWPGIRPLWISCSCEASLEVRLRTLPEWFLSSPPAASTLLCWQASWRSGTCRPTLMHNALTPATQEQACTAGRESGRRTSFFVSFVKLAFSLGSCLQKNSKWRHLHVEGNSALVKNSPITMTRIAITHRTHTPRLVYDILPSTTAVFSYAIGSRKLSANEQFFVGAQTILSLLQTIQIKQGVSFRIIAAANKVSTSANKTTIVWIETELLFFFLFFFCARGGCVSCLRACFGARLLLQSY